MRYAGEAEGAGHDEDALAYLPRRAASFRNLLLVEQPNGDFARHHRAAVSLLRLRRSRSGARCGSTRRARWPRSPRRRRRKAAYHLRHAAEWLIRLGDGTRKATAARRTRWTRCGRTPARCSRPTTPNSADRCRHRAPTPPRCAPAGTRTLTTVLAQATLARPAARLDADAAAARGRHTEHLGHLLAEMQYLQRAYPGATW